MSIPISRTTTYAPLSQVKSADLDAIQDVLSGAIPQFFDDFYCLNEEAWAIYADGLGEITGPSNNHEMMLTTGAVNGNLARIYTLLALGQLSYLPRWRARVKLSTTATRYDLVGLCDTSFAERAVMYRDTAVSNNLKLAVRGTAGLETFDTAFSPAANTWYWLTVEILSTTSVYWAVATDPTAAPAASGTVTMASAITSTDGLLFEHRSKTLSAAAVISRLDCASVAPGRAA